MLHLNVYTLFFNNILTCNHNNIFEHLNPLLPMRMISSSKLVVDGIGYAQFKVELF